ncbi:CDC50 family protein [Hesseltinella vesiculosa]|uniref:CDC50 family protein n=1 Tax=Hesseltinella vesiculosa TaxID=101127 RepID=A0A1X2GI22_9FUNG|nr:CDC50 family protein [Hesseltinella vesiculosa]
MDKRNFKNRKPSNGAFRQQRLRAWQPVLRPTAVIPVLFAIGILFLPIGGVLYWNAGKSTYLMIDYTTCKDYDRPVYLPPSMYRYRFNTTPRDDFSTAGPLLTMIQPPTFYYQNASSFADPTEPTFQYNSHWPIKQCVIDFTVPNAMKAPVNLYYRLTNFYQNHNQYIKSYDADQLTGAPLGADSLAYYCDPITTSNGKPVYPCGLVANSMFNETVSDLVLVDDALTTISNYTWIKTGLIWPHDQRRYGTSRYNVNDIVPPPNWQSRFPNGSYSEQYPPPDLATTMDRLKVWMTLAAMPDFMKLWGKNDVQDLPMGRYRVHVDLSYDTLSYGGRKWLVVASESPLGTRNFFLALTYMATGGLCILIGGLFTFLHCICPRTMEHWQPVSNSDIANIDEPTTEPADDRSATAAANE